MGDAPEPMSDVTDSKDMGAFTLSSLRSEKSSRLLQQVASLRARGIGDHIGLPQLVVCGDQSTGKSSVLEGLTGLPFPRSDGLCTTFPTEIVFTHSEFPVALTASIIPSRDRSDQSRLELQQYSKTIKDFVELPDIISDVSVLMKTVGADSERPGSVFVEDFLRIHVTGNTGLHLTVVDLPGLISVPNEEQTEHDVRVVHSLVDTYCQNPRTIILAVVQATNDIANQAIILKSKKFDPDGSRTIGIITKPDMVNIGTESRIAMLAKNEDTTKLKLGFYLIKNPSPKDLEEGITPSDRILKERLFFHSPPWNTLALNKSRLGISNSQTFLQELLRRHIEKEMPNVREDIAKKLKEVQADLNDLGEERSTETQMRVFLSRLAMRFHSLTNAALRGDYDSVDSAFFAQTENDYATRLRAFIHIANTSFSDFMREHGTTMRVVSVDKQHVDVDADHLGAKARNHYGQIEISKREMDAFVKSVYRRTRGQELPGTQNHVLLTELFHHDSQRWVDLTKQHVTRVEGHLRSFLKKAINYLTSDPRVRGALLQQIEMDLLEHRDRAGEEVQRLREDKDGPPITYNHYFTDNVQKARIAMTKDLIKKAIVDTSTQDYAGNFHVSNTQGALDKLVDAVQQKVTVNMDDQACSEARDALSAYYKVARKTFVDNVCVQVIERHLLKTLPKMFSPEIVAGYTAEELFRTAGEDESTLSKRKELQAMEDVLQKSLIEL